MSAQFDNDQSRSYRLIRPLNELYQCQIHLAEWSGVEGFVKQLTVWHVRPELCTNEEAVDTLLAGLKSAAALSASTGAQILDVWWQDSRIVLASEHISGLTMYQAMRKAAELGSPLPIDIVLQASLEIAHALEHAHDPETRAGSVIHGDLRPDVVLFGYEGAVKVSGFGFAEFLPLVSTEGGWCTWQGRCYQPAERFEGAQPTPETDVFSLGAMLLEAATGIPPYGSSEPQKILEHLRAKEGALPRDRSEIPEDLYDIIGRACASDPRYRYASMAEFAADLYRVQIERLRNASTPPPRLRQVLRTIESPSQRRAKVENPSAQAAPSHKSQLMQAPRLSKMTKPPPITAPMRDLVGRTEVLRAFSQALAGTDSGHGQAILIKGAEGMGKSRLLAEVALRLSSSKRNLAWVHTQSQPQENTLRYSAVLRLLSSAIGIAPEAHLGELGEQAERLRAFGLDWTTLSAVRGLLGHEKPPEPARLAGLLSQGVLQCLSGLSWEQNTIVAWDDLQFTDEDSIACLKEVLEQLPLIPVLILLTAGSDFVLPFKQPALRVIELGPLTIDETRNMIVQRVERAKRVDQKLMEAVFERSGGTPALIEELLDLLIEADWLEIQGKTVGLRPGQAVPELGEGVRQRFETLSPEVTTIAIIAALAGPAIDLRVFIKATGKTEEEIQAALEELVRRRVLVFRRRSLVFPHQKLREATLSAASHKDLTTLRETLAHAILAEADDGADGWRDHATNLLVEAGDRGAAAEVYVETAQRKELKGDLGGAAERYDKALDLSSNANDIFGPLETLRLSLKAGHAALHSLRLDLGEKALRRARVLATEAGNTAAGARARVMLCRLLARQGRLKDAMDVVQEAIPLAEKSNDPVILAQVYNAIAESYQQWGEYGPDLDYIEPALRLASESGDLLQLGRSLQLAVTHAAGLGEYHRTEEILKRAHAIAKTSGDPLLLAQLIRSEALLLTFSGEPERALRRTLEGLELAHHHGLSELEIIFLHNAGDAHLRCGRMQESLYYFNESQRRSMAARFDRLTEGNEMYIGFLEATYLNNSTGLKRLNKATEMARQTGRIWNVTQGHQLMGRTLLGKGDIAEALNHFEEALRLAEASRVAFFVKEAKRWLEEAKKVSEG